MKTENPDAVKFAIKAMANRQTTNTEDSFNKLPVIAYELSQYVGNCIQKVITFNNLPKVLSSKWTVETLSNVGVYINIEDEFVVCINNRCEPAVYIKNSKAISDLQMAGKVGKYIEIDDNTIFTNSTMHSTAIFKKYIEFASRSRFSIADIYILFNDICNIVSQYTSSVKNIEKIVKNKPQPITIMDCETYNRHLDLDMNEFTTECTHTALTTGAWDE